MISKLTDVGQIRKGDILIVTNKGRGGTKVYKAKKILRAGLSTEEVILKSKKNIYFITSMSIDGTSWASNVMILNSSEEGK